ncbi:ArsR/SmtB family transcription factor [Kiloniella sp.]|uniref:ArsR/SmtB family transcription factor n=1 Tax=Kiloniella sp. TaxID=1938587 RepID=UPI003A919FC7
MHIQETFRALADPTRREILLHLSRQQMTIGEVTEKFDITRAAVKKHLNILEEGQLISVHVQGRERINRLEAQGLSAVSDWIGYFDQFWDQHLGALKNAVENSENAKRQAIKGKI